MSYPALFNILQCPVVSFPVRRITAEEETYSSLVQDGYTREAKVAMEETQGLRVNVQLAALPFKDEQLLGLLTQLKS